MMIVGAFLYLVGLLWQYNVMTDAITRQPEIRLYLTPLGKGITIFSIITPMVIAVFLFWGANWARTLFFVVYVPTKIVMTIWIAMDTDQWTLLTRLPFLVIYSAVLMLPSVKQFFTGKSMYHREKDGVYHEPVPRHSSRSRSSRTQVGGASSSSSRSRRRYDY